ncbi:alpha/beta fold hydrolase [Pseudomonas sp. BGI-2]|uniref:alpha/beta fold hydrolase n=1 Tax=Pseudomonas sp. BGI-2 TaxID=2528211 RepID=UPI0035326541
MGRCRPLEQSHRRTVDQGLHEDPRGRDTADVTGRRCRAHAQDGRSGAGAGIAGGHSYGGAVITEADDQPNVVGLVYIAAFAPDASESPGRITQRHPPVAAANLASDSDVFVGQT